MTDRLDRIEAALDRQIELNAQFRTELEIISNAIESQRGEMTQIKLGFLDIQQSIAGLEQTVAQLLQTAQTQGQAIAQLGQAAQTQGQTVAQLLQTAQTQGQTIVQLGQTAQTQGQAIAQLGQTAQTQNDTSQRIQSNIEVLVNLFARHVSDGHGGQNTR